VSHRKTIVRHLSSCPAFRLNIQARIKCNRNALRLSRRRGSISENYKYLGRCDDPVGPLPPRARFRSLRYRRLKVRERGECGAKQHPRARKVSDLGVHVKAKDRTGGGERGGDARACDDDGGKGAHLFEYPSLLSGNQCQATLSVNLLTP